MDDDYYLQQRRTQAMERQNYELAEQNRLNEMATRLQAAQLEVTRKAAQAQILQNAQMIDTLEQQVAATYDAAEATWENVQATYSVAEAIENGQRAWAEVELAKAERRMKKDADKEFTRKQEHKAYLLWERIDELDDPPSTPGAKFMLWNELRDEYADIAFDAIGKIEYKDRAHKVGVKLRDFIKPLVNKYPLLGVVAADYHGKIARAKRLQEQPYFRTFEENAYANIFLTLNKQFPELKIPGCATFPQKSYCFLQDVSRLKNLCALLGDAVANDKDAQAIIVSAFHLDPAVFGEEKWAVITPAKMPADEISFYYRFYRNTRIDDSTTPADVLQRLLQRLTTALKIDAKSVEAMRRIERQKRDEVAAIDNQLASMERAKQEEKERKERERLRQEKREKQERLRKEKEERQRQEAERQRQRVQQRKDGLAESIFGLLKMRCGGIVPCVSSPKAIRLGDALLGYSDYIYIFGNRLQTLYIEQINDKKIYHVRAWTWKWVAAWDGRFDNDTLNTFAAEFRKAKGILPPAAGMEDYLEIVVTPSIKNSTFLGCLVCLVVFGLVMISMSMASIFGGFLLIIISLALIFCYFSLKKMPEKMLRSILRKSSSANSLLANIQSCKLLACESITREGNNENNENNGYLLTYDDGSDDSDDDEFDDDDE